MSDESAHPAIDDPDLPLVERARVGDFAAFDELVSRHERGLYTLALRITRQAQDAEEIVQETFVSVLEHLVDFGGRSSFRTWLSRIAVNRALKVLRKRRVRGEVALDAGGEGDPLPHPEFIAQWRDDPQRLAERAETRRLLDDAIAGLDEKHRLVFILRDVEGLSTEETAQALGISVANAKVRLLRARLTLREKLTRVFGDEATRVVPTHDHHGEEAAPKKKR